MPLAECFTPIEGPEALEPLFVRSQDEPVVLFLHAPNCPIGAAAYREMVGLNAPAVVVDVARQREVTRAVETLTGVRHESPQVLVLRHGRAAWVGSHWSITADAVSAAVERAA